MTNHLQVMEETGVPGILHLIGILISLMLSLSPGADPGIYHGGGGGGGRLGPVYHKNPPPLGGGGGGNFLGFPGNSPRNFQGKFAPRGGKIS